jgi:hypothetical protein
MSRRAARTGHVRRPDNIAMLVDACRNTKSSAGQTRQCLETATAKQKAGPAPCPNDLAITVDGQPFAVGSLERSQVAHGPPIEKENMLRTVCDEITAACDLSLIIDPPAFAEIPPSVPMSVRPLPVSMKA